MAAFKPAQQEVWATHPLFLSVSSTRVEINKRQVEEETMGGVREEKEQESTESWLV